MKKRILPILLLLSPYFYLIIVFLGFRLTHATLGDGMLLLPFCGFIVAVFIPNMVYAFVLAKRGEKSTTLLFWDMLLKLCNIPIFVAVFLLGMLMSMTLIQFAIVVVLVCAAFDYALLLPSTMYGISGLIQARREGKITTATFVINVILHFWLCTDVISAIVMYWKVSKKSKVEEEKVDEAFMEN